MGTSRQVVQIVSGGVVDEVTRIGLGRAPLARDGTWLWEVEAGGESRLIPIATAEGTRVIELGEEGLVPWRT